MPHPLTDLPVRTATRSTRDRCIDGDAAALSSVRVMGPCGAEGFAAAHVLDLVGKASVHEVALGELAERVAGNVEN
jgi:hypothetical protein